MVFRSEQLIFWMYVDWFFYFICKLRMSMFSVLTNVIPNIRKIRISVIFKVINANN